MAAIGFMPAAFLSAVQQMPIAGEMQNSHDVFADRYILGAGDVSRESHLFALPKVSAPPSKLLDMARFALQTMGREVHLDRPRTISEISQTEGAVPIFSTSRKKHFSQTHDGKHADTVIFSASPDQTAGSKALLELPKGETSMGIIGKDDAADTVRAARKRFETFLQSHAVVAGTASEDGMTLDKLFPDAPTVPELAEFRALDDTLLYSDLLVKLLEITQSSDNLLIDLGAGSSIPTIRAVLSAVSRPKLKVVAVDNSPHALETSRRNVGLFGLTDQYTLIQRDMLEFLSCGEISHGHIVAANPPYLPVPPGTASDFYKPVDGGPDGSKYLEAILTHPFSSGTIIALEWCSLSNPMRIINLIEDGFDVIYVAAHRAPFGTYTGSSPLREYLEEQRGKGLAVFDTVADRQNYFMFVGCILKKR